MAWLFALQCRARDELEQGRLVSAAPVGGASFALPMNLHAYREKPVGKEPFKPVTQALWRFLQEQAAQMALADG